MSYDESAASPESSPSRARWSAPALVVAALVALIAAALVGGVVGRSTAPGPTIVVAPGPVVEESPEVSQLPVAAGDGAGASPGPIVVAPARPDLQVSTYAAGPWPAIFSPAADLPNDPGTASGYRLSSAGLDGAALTTSLARTFGLAGDVATTEAGWIVGTVDATTPTVTVSDDPLLSWSFDDPAAQARAQQGAAIASEGAKDMASALLGTIGVDVSSVDWQVDRYADGTSVVAWQVIAGARTRLAWQVRFGIDGEITSASGFSAGLEEVPGYPVVGASTAVRRASLPTWAAIGPTPILAGTTDDALEPSPAPTPARIAAPNGRTPLRVDMSEILVTEAELGLAQFWQPDGDLLILPAYELTGDDGTRWSLIAVTGEDVDFVDQPYPTSVSLAP